MKYIFFITLLFLNCPPPETNSTKRSRCDYIAYSNTLNLLLYPLKVNNSNQNLDQLILLNTYISYEECKKKYQNFGIYPQN